MVKFEITEKSLRFYKILCAYDFSRCHFLYPASFHINSYCQSLEGRIVDTEALAASPSVRVLVCPVK